MMEKIQMILQPLKNNLKKNSLKILLQKINFKFINKKFKNWKLIKEDLNLQVEFLLLQVEFLLPQVEFLLLQVGFLLLQVEFLLPQEEKVFQVLHVHLVFQVLQDFLDLVKKRLIRWIFYHQVKKQRQRRKIMLK